MWVGTIDTSLLHVCLVCVLFVHVLFVLFRVEMSGRHIFKEGENVIGSLFNIHRTSRKIAISLYQLKYSFTDTLLILIDSFTPISVAHIHIP